MSFIAPDVVVARRASRQHGVVSRAQVLDAGLTPDQIHNRVKSGAWERVLPNVYRFAASPPSDRQDVWAAWLWAGADAAVSHRSAAVLWGIDVAASPKPELVVSATRAPRHRAVQVHRTLLLPASDVRRIDGLRVTSPERTAIELAAVLSGEDLEVALESARLRGLVTAAGVERRLERFGSVGRAGTAELRQILAHARTGPPTESRLEVKVARLIRASALPPPQRQFAVRVGARRYRLDFAWPWLRVALEAEGRRAHSHRDAFERDRRRWSALASRGWLILFATWADVTRRPGELVARIATALESAA